MPITEEQAVPGTSVWYTFDDVSQPTSITGTFQDPELGLMVQCGLYPGGMPAERYSLDGEVTETAVEIIPAVTFEVAIIDEKEPVKITSALIRQKSKVLTDLTIANIFDEKGYDAVKKAGAKAVKTRTAIEKKEKEHLGAIKIRHAAEIKEVKDYTGELYTTCREIEKEIQDKIDVIDTAKKAAADLLEKERLEKTEAREAKMYELGMTFNGTQFAGYGKSFSKDDLHGFITDFYNSLVVEIEGLQLEQGVTGKVIEQPPVASPVRSGSISWGGSSAPAASPGIKQPRAYPKSIYDRTLPDGTRIVLTIGAIDNPEVGALVVNDLVKGTQVHVQVIK